MGYKEQISGQCSSPCQYQQQSNWHKTTNADEFCACGKPPEATACPSATCACCCCQQKLHSKPAFSVGCRFEFSGNQEMVCTKNGEVCTGDGQSPNGRQESDATGCCCQIRLRGHVGETST